MNNHKIIGFIALMCCAQQSINSSDHWYHYGQPTAHSESEGISFTGSNGVTEQVSAIMARPPIMNNLAAQQKQGVRLRRTIPNREYLSQHPLSTRVEEAFAEHMRPYRDSARSIQTVQTIGLNFLGAQYSESGFVPPDADGAVGPQQYLLVASGIVKTFNKATGALDGVIDTSLDNFFQSVLPAGSFVGDIRVFYDINVQRFFVLGRSSETATERMLIAVSKSNVITAQSYFTFFYIATSSFTGGLELDYPTLGNDTNAIYTGANLFDSNGNFVNSVALVIQKSSLLANGPIYYTAFSNLINFSTGTGQVSPVGVNNFDQNATQGYFIGTSAFNYGALVLNIISNPGSAHPTISAPITIPVAPTSAPILVQHKGNTNGAQGLIGPTDDRLNWSHIRNGKLWTCNNAIGVNNAGTSSGTISRDAIRWYELDLTNPNAPSVTQYGTLYNATAVNDANELNYFVGGLMTSGQGHMLVGSTVGGISSYLNATLAGHLATDVAGTLELPINYTNSNTAYNLSWDLPIYGFHRWGDYSTISIDPADNMTLWSIQEYCNASNSWGLQVAKIMAPPPATIINVTPSVIPTGNSAASLTITGQSVNGSGFYDPGVGFTNRLQVSVSGGVVVKSITYINPTTITITLDTTQSRAGTQTITVINPDGQQMVKANALTIITSNTGPTGATGLTGSSGSSGATASTGSSGIGQSGINNIYLGTSGSAGDASTIRIGTLNLQNNCYIQGIYQSSAGNAPLLVQVGSEGKLSTVAASGRYRLMDSDELHEKIKQQDERIDHLYHLVSNLTKK